MNPESNLIPEQKLNVGMVTNQKNKLNKDLKYESAISQKLDPINSVPIAVSPDGMETPSGENPSVNDSPPRRSSKMAKMNFPNFKDMDEKQVEQVFQKY